MLLGMEIVVAVVFFVNKFFLLVDRKDGWLWGAVGCLLAIVYFYLIHLFVYMVMDVGLVILMTYGYLKKDAKRPMVELTIQITSAVVMIIMAYCAFNGMLTVLELVSAMGMLIGTYLLSHEKVRIGWILYAITGVLAVFVCIEKYQQVLVVFQICQVVFALFAIFGEQRKSSPSM